MTDAFPLKKIGDSLSLSDNAYLTVNKRQRLNVVKIMIYTLNNSIKKYSHKLTVHTLNLYKSSLVFCQKEEKNIDCIIEINQTRK